MSKQKISSNVRKALWLAHNKKCVYTNEPITYGNMDVDHIIPESYLNNDEEFKKLERDYGLVDFKKDPFKNLVPCERSKNLQKGKRIFNSNATHFYLNIASSNYSKFLAELRKLESNKAKRKICELLMELKFVDGSIVREIEVGSIEDLWDKALLIGGNPEFKNINLSKDHKFLQVSTCREFKNAVDKGFEPASNTDTKLSSPFKILCKLLVHLSKMQPSTESFISNPRLSILDLRLLPARLLELTDIGENASIKYTSSTDSMQDVLNLEKFKIKSTTSTSISIESDGMGLLLSEVARGDFDDDGIEDILIFSYVHSLTGTFGYADIHILARKDNVSHFTMLEE